MNIDDDAVKGIVKWILGTGGISALVRLYLGRKKNIDDAVNRTLDVLLADYHKQLDDTRKEIKESHSKHDHCQRNLTMSRTYSLLLSAQLKDIRTRLQMPEPSAEELVAHLDDISKQKITKFVMEDAAHLATMDAARMLNKIVASEDADG